MAHLKKASSGHLLKASSGHLSKGCPQTKKLYIVDGSTIYEYDLGTAWDVSTASFNQSATLSNDLEGGLFIRSDGLKMYAGALSGDDKIREYDFDTAYDVSTLSLANTLDPTDVSGDVNASVTSVFVGNDGFDLYHGNGASTSIDQISLSTAWDLSSATSHQRINTGVLNGLWFKDDGSLLIALDQPNDDLLRYNLSTSWDITTASQSQAFDISGQGGEWRGLGMRPDGTRVYAAEQNSAEIVEYGLSSAWDLSTASHNNDFDTSSQTGSPDGVMVFS